MATTSTASTHQLSPFSRATLHHLQNHHPLDGFTIERYLSANGKHLVRLKRRNVPLHDEGFIDLVVNSDGCVVGIQVFTSKGDAGRGVVLIRKDGKICNIDRDGEVVTVSMEHVKKVGFDGTAAAAAMAGLRSSTTPRRSNNVTNHTDNQLLSDADNQLLLQYGLTFLAGLILLKILLHSLQSLSFLLLPLVYIYAIQTCPSTASFDSKRELKRVLRGAHLPEEQQPQGFLERGINRLAATIGTELATSLGYELSVEDYFGAVKVAWVRVPVAGMDFYWVGVFGKWRFLFQREIPGSKKTN